MLIAGSILLILVLANQLKEKPLTGKLYRQPLALLFFTACALPFMPAFLPADWIMLSAVAALSFGVGLIQGRFSPLVRHDGEWYLSGSLLAASMGPIHSDPLWARLDCRTVPLRPLFSEWAFLLYYLFYFYCRPAARTLHHASAPLSFINRHRGPQ